jgi:hypothetical protein
MMEASVPQTLDANRIGGSRGLVVKLHPLIVHEWRDDHCLSRRSLMWIVEHAEADDPKPIASVIAALRTTEVQPPS